jgi:hypothetical protein
MTPELVRAAVLVCVVQKRDLRVHPWPEEELSHRSEGGGGARDDNERGGDEAEADYATATAALADAAKHVVPVG